ncbi:LLM class F420-dependent oxidoreductase [Agromyces sp. CFH 90414]|uniref:LLM class F420-dependent oxidoreductase n=1 Tax=Agromyces agglutinans TaxID=2662258 RepID=A0A6I2F7L1_9MICO|nr:LLM class F420-dependent oxidoreductase [Agromyces agglutinans]MRG59757.1 LLM class F420-dependent oxidoreductase [Agromyces agglutinans]
MRLDTPVRLGIQVQPQHAEYSAIRDTVLRLEELGVDIAFNWDHFFPLTGDPEGLHFEAWTMLGAWAEQTERIEFGTLVNCNSYRGADLQADMARTLDHISAKGSGTGRFIFGTGAGWFERDYDEYGYPFGTPGSRLRDLADALPRIRARWAALNPAPTRDIPIMIGGKGEQKTLRIVAEHADIWHSFVAPGDLAHKLDVIARWGDEVGRDVSDLVVSNELTRGTPDLEHADALYDAGVRLFTLGISGPDYDLDAVRGYLAWRDAKNG